MNVHLVYHPATGGSQELVRAGKVPGFPEGTGFRLHDLSLPEEPARCLQEAGSEEPIVICGGDGTLNRFINDEAAGKPACPLYYYAIGTGNDFLTDLGKEVGADPVPLEPYLQDLPTVTVKGKTYRFLNNVGFGIDGYCCEVADRQRAVSDKPVNYASIAIRGMLGGWSPVNATVSVDGEELKLRGVWLAPTMNGRYYGGGMMAAPKQDRLSPERTVSLLLMYGGGRLRTLIAFPSIFKGEHVKHKKMVKILTGHRIHVEFDRPCALQIDGETILGVTGYDAVSGAGAGA